MIKEKYRMRKKRRKAGSPAHEKQTLYGALNIESTVIDIDSRVILDGYSSVLHYLN